MYVFVFILFIFVQGSILWIWHEKGLYVREKFWNVHLFRTEFDHPEVKPCIDDMMLKSSY